MLEYLKGKSFDVTITKTNDKTGAVGGRRFSLLRGADPRAAARLCAPVGPRARERPGQAASPIRL